MDAIAKSVQEGGVDMRTIVETSKGYVLVDTCDTADHGLETIVFKCTEDGEVQSWRDLDTRRYVTVPEAEKGHMDMIEKWRSR